MILLLMSIIYYTIHIVGTKFPLKQQQWKQQQNDFQANNHVVFTQDWYWSGSPAIWCQEIVDEPWLTCIMVFKDWRLGLIYNDSMALTDRSVGAVTAQECSLITSLLVSASGTGGNGAKGADLACLYPCWYWLRKAKQEICKLVLSGNLL